MTSGEITHTTKITNKPTSHIFSFNLSKRFGAPHQAKYTSPVFFKCLIRLVDMKRTLHNNKFAAKSKVRHGPTICPPVYDSSAVKCLTGCLRLMQECFLKRRVAMPAELSWWQPVTPNQLQAPVAKLKVTRYCIRFPFKLNLDCGPETNKIGRSSRAQKVTSVVELPLRTEKKGLCDSDGDDWSGR